MSNVHYPEQLYQRKNPSIPKKIPAYQKTFGNHGQGYTNVPRTEKNFYFQLSSKMTQINKILTLMTH